MRQLGGRLLDEIESYSSELARINSTQGDRNQRLALAMEMLERQPGLKLWRSIPSRSDLLNQNIKDLLKILQALWDTLQFVKAMRGENFEFSEQALRTRIFTSKQDRIMELIKEITPLSQLTHGVQQSGFRLADRGNSHYVSNATTLLRGYEESSEVAVQHFLAYMRDDFAQKVSRAAPDVLLIVHEKIPERLAFRDYRD